MFDITGSFQISDSRCVLSFSCPTGLHDFLSDVRSCDLHVYRQSGLDSDPGMMIHDVYVSFSSTEASHIMPLRVYITQYVVR